MSLLTNLFRLIPPSFRPGYCPASIQQLSNDLINGTQVTFLIQQGNFLYNYGSATPAPENRIFPWLVIPSGRWYTFQYGLWTSPMDPASREPTFRKMWKPAAGTPESALWSLDGGTGEDPTVTPPTLITGASWAVDHDFDGRFPLAAGAVPGATPATTVSVAATGGLWQSITGVDQLPKHHHTYKLLGARGTDLDAALKRFAAMPDSPGNPGPLPEQNFDTSDVGVDPATTDLPVTAPPYFVVYWIKPTNRKFYVLPA